MAKRALIALVVLGSAVGVCGCASSPVQPAPASARHAVPVGIPKPVPVPELFIAVLAGRSGCPAGQAKFMVPWTHSPHYDPKVVFIRAPDPVAVCVEFAGDADALAGASVKIEKSGARYEVIDPLHRR